MLEQLCEGLQTLGVLDLVRKNQTQMKPIFTPIGNSVITNDQLLDILSPNYSESTHMKDQEINTFKAMCDFIQELYFQG